MGDGVLVVFAAPDVYRNNDVEHEWRQDSDFHYLSGFDEPESVLVLRGGAEPRFVLFVRKNRILKERSSAAAIVITGND